MSSNRSISGARQRRAGEQAPSVGPRSNTSIGSQQIFAKQQIQINQQKVQQKQGQVHGQIQENMEAQPMGKLSIPKAFTLVTLRLGRIEQFIQQIQEEGGLSSYEKDGESGVDDAFLNNILTRLETLEKNNNKIPSLNNEKSIEDVKVNISKLDKDMRETKDLLMMMMMKYEKFTLETTDKIENLSRIIEDLTTNKDKLENYNDYEEEHEDHMIEMENEVSSIINLKEVIENELANEL
jgi:hypothetical protein